MSGKALNGVAFELATGLPGASIVTNCDSPSGSGRHFHDSLCFGPVLRGKRCITTAGQIFEAPKGHIVALNPGEVHSTKESQDASFFMLAIPESLVLQLLGESAPLPLLKGPVLYDPLLFKRLDALNEATREDASPMEIQGHAAECLTRLFNNHSTSAAEEPETPHRAVSAAKEYILEHWDEAVSLADLARETNLSQCRISRVFASTVGMPPHEFINFVRVRASRKLIEDGMPLAEVAAVCGFADQSHMNRAFGSVLGMTPGQYAQAHRK